MQGLEHTDKHLWNPFKWLGIDSNYLKVNTEVVFQTWIVLLVMIVLLIVCRYFLNKKNTVITFFLKSYVGSFKELVTSTLGFYKYSHFAFVTVMFTFIAACNWIALIPYMEEPTRDLNTTLAFGLISFFYKDFYAIKTHGFKSFIEEFLHPFFLMFPLNVVGHFSKVISLSFRLFGNIFGGSIISTLYLDALKSSYVAQVLGLITGINYIVMFFFIFFEGLIQAFVFAMLTLTYLSIAIQAAEDEVPDV